MFSACIVNDYLSNIHIPWSLVLSLSHCYCLGLGLMDERWEAFWWISSCICSKANCLKIFFFPFKVQYIFFELLAFHGGTHQTFSVTLHWRSILQSPSFHSGQRSHSSRLLPAVQQLCSSGKPQWAQEAETLLNQKKRGRSTCWSFILSQSLLYNFLQYRQCGIWWNSGFMPSEGLIKEYHFY